MKKYYKYLSALMLSSLSLVLCSMDTAEGPDGVNRPQPACSDLTFRVKPFTRNSAGSLSSETLQDFGVFASLTGAYQYHESDIYCKYMWNEKVERHGSKWEYVHTKIWPNDGKDYVTFYAYAPYSAATSSDCIFGFSNNDEVGDPWLVYQLAETNDRQVDLLYDCVIDARKQSVSSRVTFTFKHALASYGDEIVVTCGDALQNDLMAEAASAEGGTVTMTLDKLTLDYSLIRKGKLYLNSGKWVEVASETDDPMIHRVITMEPGKVVATATASGCTLSDYSTSGKGVFYIPMNLAGHDQQVTVTAEYTLSTGYHGSVTNTVVLDPENNASVNKDIRMVFSGNTPVRD